MAGHFDRSLTCEIKVIYLRIVVDNRKVASKDTSTEGQLYLFCIGNLVQIYSVCLSMLKHMQLLYEIVCNGSYS